MRLALLLNPPLMLEYVCSYLQYDPDHVAQALPSLQALGSQFVGKNFADPLTGVKDTLLDAAIRLLTVHGQKRETAHTSNAAITFNYHYYDMVEALVPAEVIRPVPRHPDLYIVYLSMGDDLDAYYDALDQLAMPAAEAYVDVPHLAELH